MRRSTRKKLRAIGILLSVLMAVAFIGAMGYHLLRFWANAPVAARGPELALTAFASFKSVEPRRDARTNEPLTSLVYRGDLATVLAVEELQKNTPWWNLRAQPYSVAILARTQNGRFFWARYRMTEDLKPFTDGFARFDHPYLVTRDPQDIQRWVRDHATQPQELYQQIFGAPMPEQVPAEEAA